MSEIFRYFLRLGCLGFGGPLAVVAQMQTELIMERHWMTEDEFRQSFGLIKAMPGPVAFQTAVFLGQRRGGFWGGLLAGIGMVFPAFVFMCLLAIFYDQFRQISGIQSLMNGMELGAFALILWALKSLAQSFLKRSLFWAFLICGLLLVQFTEIPEPVLILFFGGLSVATYFVQARKLSVIDPTLISLTLVCLKAGAFVFGTGLAIVPFLEGDFVRHLHWLTHNQFMDALSFGQLTPGPVVVTVTFIGYKVAGWTGAILATIAIFLPSFFHMVTWFPRVVVWLQKQKWVLSFTLGVTAAVCSAIIWSLIRLSDSWNVWQLGGVAALLLLIQFSKIPSWGIIFIGGALGFILPMS